MSATLTVNVELRPKEALALVRLCEKLELPIDKVITNAIRLYHDDTFPVKKLEKKLKKKQSDRCRDCGASPIVNNSKLCVNCDRLNYAG